MQPTIVEMEGIEIGDEVMFIGADIPDAPGAEPTVWVWQYLGDTVPSMSTPTPGFDIEVDGEDVFVPDAVYAYHRDQWWRGRVLGDAEDPMVLSRELVNNPNDRCIFELQSYSRIFVERAEPLTRHRLVERLTTYVRAYLGTPD